MDKPLVRMIKKEEVQSIKKDITTDTADNKKMIYII